VRNSGATTVVEGIGDHGCEYMTGGAVLILGTIGQNFGAGMSGGVAYVLDSSDKVRRHCNPASVEVADPDPENLSIIRELLQRHLRYTGSQQARQLLANWPVSSASLVLVRPRRRGAGVSGVPQPRQDSLPETAAALA
jgi:glutamate synthase (NADPH/NADH) large chain